ncbi:MAG TPA: hypothetical protein VFO10_17535 [Oligoflexus sp.]|uniref:hypothetical protein n=1 Tax=Oligoflexus sp. TaxID=1971216 RepID=UPI002D7F7472|nr:hypothetical protein [Oligoflexus sp.]HET9239065.1 hypothetical protein [Oligoflexus sp.]
MLKKTIFVMLTASLMCAYTCSGKKRETPALDHSQLVVHTSGLKGAEAASKLCNPGHLGVYPEEASFNIPPWTGEFFVSGQDTADKLNSLKNGPTRIYLGQCLRYASDKLLKDQEKGDMEGLGLASQAFEYYLAVLDLAVAKQEEMLKSGN